jgi:hypothetical protein
VITSSQSAKRRESFQSGARPEDRPLIVGHFEIAEVIGTPLAPGDVSCGAFVEIGEATFLAGPTKRERAQPDSGLLASLVRRRRYSDATRPAGSRLVPGAPAPQSTILPMTLGTEDTIRAALPAYKPVADKPVDVR